MAKVLVTSDWHISPSLDLVNKLSEHIDYCEGQLTRGYRIILAGDIFNALECGWGAYRHHPIIKRLSQWDNLDIIEGNHDRKNPYLPTKPSVVIDNIYFCHGHQFDILWGWLPIYRIPIPHFIQRWYRTPAKKKKGELRDYHLASMQIEYSAGKDALKNGYKAIIFGHTHLPMIIWREDFILANCGDGVDSFSFLELDTETLDIQQRNYS